MSLDRADDRLAVKARTLARLLDTSPTTLKRLVATGALPPPFRMSAKGARLWWWPDVRSAVELRAGRQSGPA